MRADGVHQQGLPERRAPPGLALQVDRRGHVHERQRDELGEPARLLLQGAGAHEVAGPRAPAARSAPNMIVTLERRPTRVGDPVDLEPLLGVDLVGAEHGPHLVVEDLGRRARQGGQAGVLQAAQVVDQRLAEPLAPSVTSRAVKPWTWMPGATAFTARVTSM